ncbi:Glutamate--tRNA ligase [Seminavis robusta]|uniref:glutamate--tRNA ligase n=1 Tax=Seminavis robusta TaxID=568900 RepID=A0A9N8DB01_9STRA|nr:Glutamate--tRNA ligase [Seminavis robusta]|eukprot:Sro20_g014070.1 Glutamate--tRNA ligase (871) ;mRNA; f:75116-78060
MQLRTLTTPTVMAIVSIIGLTSGRFARAFVPVARRSLSTSNARSPPALTAGLRRTKKNADSESLGALLTKVQKGRGHLATLAEETEATAAELPDIIFPLAGRSQKDILGSLARMRFAPSPTGSLHVGGARTALYNWLMAKKGQLDFEGSESAFILRVEDTDLARSTKESEASVLADLQWLGLSWDEGPDMEGCNYGPYRQSERNEIYVAAANRLLQEGKAYRCFCTPEELEELKAQQEAEGIPPRYDNRWRDADPELVNKMLDAGTPFTVRFKVPDGARIVIEDVVRGTVGWDASATVGDFIMLRSNGVPVYNFCVAMDDALMGVTTVVRAEEHLTNTLRQALILDALGAPRPRYAHCSLILGEDKQKLSKRHGATSCDQFRLDGFLPDAMINYLALLGWNDGTDNEIFTRDELIDAFEVNRVVKSPSVFDMEKLKWVNSQHMKLLPIDEIADLVKDQLEWEGLLKEGTSMDDPNVNNFALAATALARQMMETTKDAATNAQQVLGYGLPATYAELQDQHAKKMIEKGNFYPLAMHLVEQFESGDLPQPDTENLLAAFGDAIGPAKENVLNCEYTSTYQKYMKALAKEKDVKGKNLFHPVRLALTGEMSGQDVTKQLSLLSMAVAEDSVIDNEKAGVVSFAERMERLKAFCESIPEEFHVAVNDKEKSKSAKKEAEAQKAKQETAAAPAGAAADPKDSYEGPPITALDIRVGEIKRVWAHEEADKLYCEEIDVGEDEPRQIASGLRPYMNAEDLEGKKVLVLCNLKARKLVGFPSHGMVLCASSEDHTDVRLVNPPVDAKIGERVTVPDFDFEGEDGAPYAENKVGKKKIVEKLAPFMVTSKYGVPEFLGRPFLTSGGVCTSAIPDGTVG